MRTEVWRRGREKKRQRTGARGSEGRNGEESPSAPHRPVEQPPPPPRCSTLPSREAAALLGCQQHSAARGYEPKNKMSFMKHT